MNLFTDPFRMIRDIGRASRGVHLWGGLLNIPQVIGGLVFITTVEGQSVLALAIVTLLVAGRIHRRTPFSRLIGLCHLPWLVLLPWLVVRLATVSHPLPLRLWAGYVAATIAVSLVFDALDVYRYAKGEKVFSWALRT